MGIGLVIAGALGACVFWLWWRRKRGCEGPGRTGMGARRRWEDRRVPTGESGIKDENKLPEGVVSAWGPEETTAPVELPAEVVAEVSGTGARAWKGA